MTAVYEFPTDDLALEFVVRLHPAGCDCATLRRGRTVWVVPTDGLEARQAFQIARELGGHPA